MESFLLIWTSDVERLKRWDKNSDKMFKYWWTERKRKAKENIDVV